MDDTPTSPNEQKPDNHETTKLVTSEKPPQRITNITTTGSRGEDLNQVVNEQISTP